MKSLTLAAVLLLVGPYQALAQETASGPRFMPFTFGALGGISGGGGGSTTLHFGGGLETVLWKGIGAGAEVGYLAPFPSGFTYGIGTVSLNGLYEPLKPGRRVTPFVTGGYSLAFREGHGNAINFGGGINYWMRDGLALRVEFRDHMPIYESAVENYHLWGMRVGLTWRR